jgi:hypothetical protein
MMINGEKVFDYYNLLNDSQIDLLEDKLPQLSTSDARYKKQRADYIRVINILVISIYNLSGYFTTKNLHALFPGFTYLAAYLHDSITQNKIKDNFSYTARLLKPEDLSEDGDESDAKRSDFYAFDKEIRWMPLEAILIVAMLNVLREENSATCFKIGMQEGIKLANLHRTDDESFFHDKEMYEQLKKQKSRDRFGNQIDFAQQSIFMTQKMITEGWQMKPGGDHFSVRIMDNYG